MTEKMSEQATAIQNMQKTIDLLLGAGAMEFGNPNDGISNKWILEPLYEKEDCAIGFVHISRVSLGPCGEHIHPESKEFLIVVQGSVMFNLNGSDVRILRVGDIATVEKGQLHFSRPLEDNTKLVYVCVPTDPYLKSVRNVERKEPDVSPRPRD